MASVFVSGSPIYSLLHECTLHLKMFLDLRNDKTTLFGKEQTPIGTRTMDLKAESLEPAYKYSNTDESR